MQWPRKRLHQSGMFRIQLTLYVSLNVTEPTEQGETYELKGSMRWNDYKIIFSQTGEVKIKISEMVKSERVHVEKTHQMGKEAQFESFKVQVDVKKGDLVIPYHIQCSPE